MTRSYINFLKDSFLAVVIVLFAALVSVLIIQKTYAQVSNNAAVSFKKDGNGLFTITIRDPQGIQEYSFKAPDKLPYGGGITGCPTSRTITNVVFNDPADFTPSMEAFVVDCKDNRGEFTIAPPKDGITNGVKIGTEPEPEKTETATTPAPAAELEQSEEPAKPVKEISYPVTELGSCKNEDDCRVYCDKPGNLEKCIVFAESHSLMNGEEAAKARKFKESLNSGGTPGGCNSQATCESYCNDVSRIDECVAFGEKNGFLKGKELEDAKKVHAAIQRGAKMPGDCRNKTACEAYCQNSEHIDECITFAKENGFMSEQELREVEKILPLMKRGETPGACKSKEQCESYCEAEEHMDECISFAEKAGLLSEEELKHVEQFKKTGGKGPGGCKGKQCQSYCENPGNQKACFTWAKENGFLEEKDLQRMEEGKQQLRQSLEQMPPEARACVDEIVGPGGLEGDFFGGPEIGEKIKSCFESAFSGFGPPGQGGPGGPGEHGGFPGGPGGGFPGGPDGGGFGGGPGGCKSIDECMKYCQEHSDECSGFGPPSGNAGDRGSDHGDGRFPGGPQGNDQGEHRGDPRYIGPPIESGAPGEFGGTRPPCNGPEECQKLYEQGGFPDRRTESPIDQLKEGFQQPPEGFTPPTNISPDQYQQQYQQQFEQQFQQQYQQEYQKQYEQQYQQQQGTYPTPTSGEYHPPEGSYTPPPSNSYPSGGSYTPPEGSYSPPPPSSYRYGPQRQSLVGSVLDILGGK
ncbi:MAG TPA: hypothetical protein VJH70_01390 [Candidatus Paceibacterota bacterium]